MTTVLGESESNRSARVLVSAPAVPAWVHALIAQEDSLVLLTTSFDNARAMSSTDFQAHVTRAYETIFRSTAARSSHAVRFWAFLPGIHDELDGGINRYMAFNSGRYDAYLGHVGSAAALGAFTPTASAVGAADDRFVLHCLAARDKGTPVENPRQTPAYHYSRRYGPRPPCFARATAITAQTSRRYLLVGGTASITGEDSRHTNLLEAQCLETIRNLSHLAGSWVGQPMSDDLPEQRLLEQLAVFRHVRVYYPEPSHCEDIQRYVRQAFPTDTPFEFLQASLCRPELLVEIEGLACPTPLGF